MKLFHPKDKKLFWVFFILLVAFFSLGPKINVVGAYYDPGTGGGGGGKISSFEKAVYETSEFNQESHSYTTTENIIQSLNNMILGCTTEACQKKLGTNAGGAVGSVSNLIASLYTNPPASSTYYLADLGQRLNIVQPAYAQGIGFSGLKPLLPLWRASRNVAYIFFILIFIITGFAIMFRAKINPQTVVTIQAAIPKAVVALILVTFSYAIAGLMIDLMYLAIGVIIVTLSKAIPSSSIHNPNYYYGAGFGTLWHEISAVGWKDTWDIVKSFPGWAIGGAGLSIAGGAGIGVLLSLAISLGAGPAAAIGAGAVAILIPLFIGIILLYIILKTFFVLLSAYIQIIIALIIAPLQLMLSAIPGQNTFSPWFKNLLKNIIIFPAVLLVIVLAAILPGITRGDPLWVPPMLGAFGEKSGEVIGTLLSLGMLLVLPQISNIINSVFEKKAFPYGTAMGETVKAPQEAVKIVTKPFSWVSNITKSLPPRSP